MQYQITIPAVPVAQPRPRAVRMPNGDARIVSALVQHPVNAFKSLVALTWQQHGCTAPLGGPLWVRMVFVMPRIGKLNGKKKPTGRVPYAAKRNDWDNLGKSVCDALNKIAWHDDGQMARVTVERWYAAADESPHVELFVATEE